GCETMRSDKMVYPEIPRGTELDAEVLSAIESALRAIWGLREGLFLMDDTLSGDQYHQEVRESREFIESKNGRVKIRCIVYGKRFNLIFDADQGLKIVEDFGREMMDVFISIDDAVVPKIGSEWWLHY